VPLDVFPNDKCAFVAKRAIHWLFEINGFFMMFYCLFCVYDELLFLFFFIYIFCFFLRAKIPLLATFSILHYTCNLYPCQS